MFDESSHRDVVSYNTLIDGVVKASEIRKARQVFDAMPLRDFVSCGTLIAGYVRANFCEKAIRFFFYCIMDLKVRPDGVALVSTLSTCAHLSELAKGKVIYDYIKSNGIRMDSFLGTAAVDFM